MRATVIQLKPPITAMSTGTEDPKIRPSTMSRSRLGMLNIASASRISAASAAPP